MRTFTITIDGERASGKTTLLNALENKLKQLGFTVIDKSTEGTKESIHIQHEL